MIQCEKWALTVSFVGAGVVGLVVGGGIVGALVGFVEGLVVGSAVVGLVDGALVGSYIVNQKVAHQKSDLYMHHFLYKA